MAEDKKRDKPPKLPRAYSMKDLSNIVYQVFLFLGEWRTVFGEPEIGATWFIWGESGNGKSTACAKLASMFTQFGKVLYLALEEKKGKSIRMKLREAGITDKSKNFQLLPRSSYQELIQRLHRKGSADIIFIDSLQYWGITYKQYQELIEIFPNKTFIFVSHAKGKSPKGSVADSIQYDAAIKIFVEGGMMQVKHRFEGGGGSMIVIPELAERYWNKTNTTNGTQNHSLEIAMTFIKKNRLQSFFRNYLEENNLDANQFFKE